MASGSRLVALEAMKCFRVLMPLLVPSPAMQLRKFHSLAATALQALETNQFDPNSPNVSILIALCESLKDSPHIVLMIASGLLNDESFASLWPKLSQNDLPADALLDAVASHESVPYLALEGAASGAGGGGAEESKD